MLNGLRIADSLLSDVNNFRVVSLSADILSLVMRLCGGARLVGNDVLLDQVVVQLGR